MRRQKNTQQMNEQGKNPPDQINEEKIGSLPEKEFRVMIVNMIQNHIWVTNQALVNLRKLKSYQVSFPTTTL